jgi:hypothetical protein
MSELPNTISVPGRDSGGTNLSRDGDTPPSRQCGRCRLTFVGDPSLYAATLQEWWLCPECHDALLGHREGARS